MKKPFKLIIAFVILTIVSFIALTIVYPAIVRHRHRIAPPGIDLMETVDIGGVPQVLYFRGQNIDNPVILFLHGGPGFPTMPFLHDFQFDWEPYFTVVHWDQRNGGRTFHLSDPNKIRDTLSFQQVLVDASEVTQHIRNTLNVDQITVLGYSWGSVLGAALVQAYPQYFNAYIGLGQVVNMRENERVGFEKLLQAAPELETLAPYPPDRPFDEAFISALTEVRRHQVRHGLATGTELSSILTLMTSPYYPLRERFLPLNNLHYQKPLLRFLFDEFDLRNFGTNYEMPVFFISGARDYQTPYRLAQSFLEEITAPHKAFFLIPDAGHGAMHDNPIEFNRILLEIIRPKILGGPIS